MIYKNAGIKSKREAAQRLLAGEVFYIGAEKKTIEFSDKNDGNPFLFGYQPLQNYWDEFAKWQVKVDWRDNIGDGVLCWVWDGDESNKRIAVVVRSMRHEQGSLSPYVMTHTGGVWRNAEPITKDEAMCIGLILECR